MDINAKQLEVLDFNYLNQAETFQYNQDQLDRVKDCQPIMAKLSNEVTAWETAIQTFDVAYRRATTTGQTKVLETMDAERDSMYSGLTGFVNNALKSPIAAQQQAAQQLQEPIKRYSISTTAEYQEQTMRLEQFCQDLLANHVAQLTALGVKEWVEALQAKNREFKAAMVQRTNEQAGYVKSELSNLRLQIINAYRVFAKLLNVVLIYEGDTAYATVVDQLNAEVRHYKQIIARKGGSSSSSSSSAGSTDNLSDTDGSGSGSETDNTNTGGTDGSGSGDQGSGSGDSGTGSGQQGGSTDTGGGSQGGGSDTGGGQGGGGGLGSGD